MKVLNLDGRTLSTKHESKLLQIKSGSENKSTLVFKNQGN